MRVEQHPLMLALAVMPVATGDDSVLLLIHLSHTLWAVQSACHSLKKMPAFATVEASLLAGGWVLLRWLHISIHQSIHLP